jgi:hypothetical protein
VRQPDAVVELHIDQIAKFRKVDVPAPVLVRPPEQVVHAVVVQGQRVLQLDQQLLELVAIDLPRAILVDALEHAFQVIYLIRQPRAFRLEMDVVPHVRRPPGTQSPVVHLPHRTLAPDAVRVDLDLVTCAERRPRRRRRGDVVSSLRLCLRVTRRRRGATRSHCDAIDAPSRHRRDHVKFKFKIYAEAAPFSGNQLRVIPSYCLARAALDKKPWWPSMDTSPKALDSRG